MSTARVVDPRGVFYFFSIFIVLVATLPIVFPSAYLPAALTFPVNAWCKLSSKERVKNPCLSFSSYAIDILSMDIIGIYSCKRGLFCLIEIECDCRLYKKQRAWMSGKFLWHLESDLPKTPEVTSRLNVSAVIYQRSGVKMILPRSRRS